MQTEGSNTAELQPSLEVVVAPSATRLPHQRGATVRLLWYVPNVRKLNRKNKITSKPFQVPVGGDSSDAAPSGGWTFRLILLRGIEKTATEAEDPVGVFVEYVPQAESSGGSVKGSDPENCKVRCRVPPLRILHKEAAAPSSSEPADGEKGPAPAVSAMGEVLHRFHPGETTAALRALVPSATLNSPDFVDSAGNMLVELKLHFGMASAVADAVAVTTEKIGSTFWRGVSAIGSTLSQLKHQVAESLHANEAKNAREEAPGSVPWESVPPKWRGREDKWVELCTVALPHNELTFISGPERGLTPDEQVLMAQMGLSHKAIMTANSDYDFDRDVHAGLLQLDALRVQRFNLVPAAVSENAFWRNYLWKVAALSICLNPEQVQLVLSILNAPARAPGRAPSTSPTQTSPAGAPPPQLADAVASAVSEAAETTTFVRDLLSDGENADPTMVETGMKSCGHQRKALCDLRRQVDVAPQAQGDAARLLQQIDAAIADIDGVLASKQGRSPSDSTPPPTQTSPPVAESVSTQHSQSASAVTVVAATPSEPQTEAAPAQSAPTPSAPAVIGVPPSVSAPNSDGEHPSGSAHSSFVDLSPSRQRSSSNDHPAEAAAEDRIAPAEQPRRIDSPTQPASAESTGDRGGTGSKVGKRDSFDELGFDDVPTIDGAAATPKALQPEPGQPAGGSTGKRSSSNLSEFAKMPWEEEDS